MNSIDINKRELPRGSPLYFFYRWVVVAPFLVFSTTVIGTSVIVLCFVGLAKFSSRVLGRLWARLNMKVAMINVDVTGHEKVDPDQSYIIVANHQSLVDIWVLYGCLDIDIKWVMKRELRAVPVLGMACELMGHIIIDRSDSTSAITSINAARDRIRDGVSVVFFPEGTRSRTEELRQFKKGAFRLAQELGLPVLPVVIHNTRTILPSDTTDLVPGNAELEFTDPIPTQGLSEDDVAKLANDVRDIITRSLEQRKTKQIT